MQADGSGVAPFLLDRKTIESIVGDRDEANVFSGDVSRCPLIMPTDVPDLISLFNVISECDLRLSSE
jgi:hypothetical protein